MPVNMPKHRCARLFRTIAGAISMGRWPASMFISGLILAAMPVQAADDVYLMMLEGETANLRLDQSGQLKKKQQQPSAKKTFEWNVELEEEKLPGDLSIEQFEAFLQQYFYGTYVFFNKLNSTDKNTVYYRYSQADKPQLENVRKNVMALLKQ